MANSYTLYNGTGAQTDFTVVKPYLSQSHVTVEVGGVEVAFTWQSSTLIRCTVAPAVGTGNVKIKRMTPRGRLVTFSDSAGLVARDLNTQALQAQYIAEEQEDAYLDGALTDLSVATSNLADGAVTTAKLGLASVTLAKLADLATRTVIGRLTGSTGVPEAVSIDDLRVIADGSTTARDLSARFASDIDPRDFGALVDGTTDDTLAYQAALDRINVLGGGRLIVPRGTSRLTASLRGYSNTTIIGSRSSVLWFDTLSFGETVGSIGDYDDYKSGGIVFNSGNLAVKTGDRSYTLSAGSPFENCWVMGITIRSNGAYTDAFQLHHIGVRMHGCKNSGVRGCYVKGFRGEAMTFQEYGEFNEFSGNFVENCAQNAFDLNGRIHHTRVLGNVAYRVGQLVESIGWDNVISGNIVDTYKVNGIYVSTDALLYEVSATIVGNRVVNFAGDPTLHDPIRVQPGNGVQRDIIIANNFIRGTCRWGISVANDSLGGGLVSVTGNIIREEGSLVDMGGGITVDGPCDLVLVQGNSLRFATARAYAAIGVAVGTSTCIVSDNVIEAASAFRGAGFIHGNCIQIPSPMTRTVRVLRNMFNRNDVGQPAFTFTASDTTPSVSGGMVFATANAVPTTISMFDDGVIGQEIVVLIADANTTVDFSSTSLKGNAGVDWVAPVNSILRGYFDGTFWRCTVASGS